MVRQERSLDKLNVKLLEVEKTLAVKQKNVDSLKEQKKNIYEMVERELSDNKHSEFLWALYHKKPTSQYQQEVVSFLTISLLQMNLMAGLRESIGKCDLLLRRTPPGIIVEVFTA